MFDSQRTAVQAEVIVFGVPHDLVCILLQIDRPGPVGIPQYLFRLLGGHAVLLNDPLQTGLSVRVEVDVQRILPV